MLMIIRIISLAIVVVNVRICTIISWIGLRCIGGIVDVRICTIISWIGLRCIGGIVSPLISGIIGGILLVIIIFSLHFR